MHHHHHQGTADEAAKEAQFHPQVLQQDQVFSTTVSRSNAGGVTSSPPSSTSSSSSSLKYKCSWDLLLCLIHPLRVASPVLTAFSSSNSDNVSTKSSVQPTLTQQLFTFSTKALPQGLDPVDQPSISSHVMYSPVRDGVPHGVALGPILILHQK